MHGTFSKPTCSLDDLLIDGPGYWYLATPMTKFPGGHQAAVDATTELLHRMTVHGAIVYAPIVATWTMLCNHGLPGDYMFWKKANDSMVLAAYGVIVGMLPTWQESAGVTYEIDFAERVGKPVLYFAP